MPAHEIEQTVLDAAHRMLEDRAHITKVLRECDVQIEQIPTILNVISSRRNIHALVDRVDLEHNSIHIMLSLKSFITGETGNHRPVITKTIPVQMKRRGVELQMTISAIDTAPPKIDSTLVKSVAQAHQWFQELASASVSSLTAIARREGVDKTHVSRVMNLAFLAPDIVDRIIAGRQPSEVTTEMLTKRITLPHVWDAQMQWFQIS